MRAFSILAHCPAAAIEIERCREGATRFERTFTWGAGGGVERFLRTFATL